MAGGGSCRCRLKIQDQRLEMTKQMLRRVVTADQAAALMRYALVLYAWAAERYGLLIGIGK